MSDRDAEWRMFEEVTFHLRAALAAKSISYDDLKSHNRSHSLLRARDITIVAARRSGMSYAAIGRCLNRDTKTVREAYQRELRRRLTLP